MRRPVPPRRLLQGRAGACAHSAFQQGILRRWEDDTCRVLRIQAQVHPLCCGGGGLGVLRQQQFAGHCAGPRILRRHLRGPRSVQRPVGVLLVRDHRCVTGRRCHSVCGGAPAHGSRGHVPATARGLCRVHVHRHRMHPCTAWSLPSHAMDPHPIRVTRILTPYAWLHAYACAAAQRLCSSRWSDSD